mmetsp:Transcript_11330/g.16301  ORF Transcript_11330/g.16301 Transcript_11330/m.16301 type:complete len:1197 (+) Transcript_11330:1-3591(+)
MLFAFVAATRFPFDGHQKRVTMRQTTQNYQQRGANDSVDSRFRVAACFRDFEPRALACSVLTRPSSSRNSSNISSAGSVCAVSGPKGIICFQNNSPQKPYLIINHISPSTRNFSLAFQPTCPLYNINNMQQNQSPFLLASAAGSGVLIYDVSGHALSPLITRLNITADYSFQSVNANHTVESNRNRAMSFSPSIGLLGPKSVRKRSIHHNRTPTSMNITDSSLAGIPSLSSATMGDTSISNETSEHHNATTQKMHCWDEVTSICWKHTRQPLLVTTSTREVSLWDLRAANTTIPGDQVLSVGVSRPTIRFASLSASQSDTELSKFVHVSCSRSQPHQVAIVDVSGIVQIYDDRVVSDNARYHNPRPGHSHPSLLDTFQAHTAQGVGIESCSDLSSETYWITWGRDRDSSNSQQKISDSCTAKIWRGPGDTESSSETMTPLSSNHSPGPAPSHSLLATLPGPINCVRVCPWPYKNTFMTVGPVKNDNASSGWRADFWEIGTKTSLESTDQSAPEVQLITSFEGEGNSVCGDLFSRSIGADDHINSFNEINNKCYLVAAELSVSNSLDSGSELEISCLSSTGYLTTYSVPEASPFKLAPFQPTGSLRNAPCEKINLAKQQVVQSKPTIFLQSPLQEKSSHDTDDNDELGIDIVTRKLSDSSILTEKIIKSFTSGEKVFRAALTLPSPDLRPVNVPNDFMLFELESAIEGSVVVPANGSAFTLPSAETPRTAVFNASLAGRIPCPRLCGACFSPGGTSLVVFSNGGVCKIWEWFNKDANNVSRRSNFASDTKRGAPKTYLDLIEMNETSKIAQWGDEEDNINRPDCNESTSSATSSSSDGDQYLNEGEDYFRQSLYDDDLKKSEPLRPVSFSRKDSNTSSIASSKRNPDQFVVPNSDPLATQVFFTGKKDVLALNDQSNKLAQLLQLGDWVSLSYDEARCIIICQKNAAACYELKLKEKGDVWQLLSQVIENHVFSSLEENILLTGDALGRELVSNLLRYYEKHGDVQMLATMVCVLSRKQRLRGSSTHYSCSDDGMPCDRMSNCNFKSRNPCVCNSLLPCDSKRYGTYIRMYGDLLYGWGMLTQRTELMKHLVYFVPSFRGNDNGTMPQCGVSQGIGVAPLCPRCLAPANPLNNVCPNCQSYAFHCTICANSVRGLFTSCFTCGHGGHFEHMMDWFADNTVCPSGCGCTCVFNTYSSQ